MQRGVVEVAVFHTAVEQVGAALEYDGPGLAADGIVTVDARSNGVFLGNQRALFIRDTVEFPVAGPLEIDKTTLKARGAGPRYYWSLFSFQNSESSALDFVLAFEPQRLPGSGVWPVAAPGEQVIQALLTREGLVPKLHMIDGVQTISLRIAAKETVNLAIETTASQLSA